MENQNQLALAKKLDRVAIAISFVVLLLVGAMRQIKFSLPFDTSFLPPFHSGVNALTAVCLVIALYFIKQKNVKMHQRTMYLALFLSFVFLLSYVLYHFTNEETSFGGEGPIKIVYYVLLISHIILAAVMLPFILFTFIRGYTGQIEKHRKMAKYTFPIWLYVAITGPICYLMLMPYYG